MLILNYFFVNLSLFFPVFISIKIEVLTSYISLSLFIVFFDCLSDIILNWSSENNSSSRMFAETFLIPRNVLFCYYLRFIISTSALFWDPKSEISYKFIFNNSNFIILSTIHSDFIYHFFLVNPEYFFASFFESNVWSRQPKPPYQWPPLSIPFTSYFLQ